MNNFDDIGLKLCRFQGTLFLLSAEKVACSSAVFIRRFMNSGYAARLDRNGIISEILNEESAFEEIETEYGKSNYGSEMYRSEELYWMGYIYRYWCYTKGKSSKEAYKVIKPGELRGLYLPYHSLDPAQAIERILEAKGLNEEDYTKRGVEIMRRIISEKTGNIRLANNQNHFSKTRGMKRP